MTERGDTARRKEHRKPRQYTRYCLREGHLFGGLCAALLITWSVMAFLVWGVVMLSLWLWSLLGGDADA